MSTYHAMRNPAPVDKSLGSEDVLVIFGEVFERGYVNGLIDAAEKQGMKIIYGTVGRRDSDSKLRDLNSEELQGKKQTPIINVPLEAGFDLEPIPSEDNLSVVDLLKDCKLSEWQGFSLPKEKWQAAQKKAQTGFQNRAELWAKELAPHLENTRHVIFAHIMAGGVPRAKIIMPLMNRVFKGKGDRHLPSKEFLDHDLGKLCLESFNDVTAGTFATLIEVTEKIRSEKITSGKKVGYVAYGYHGTEVLVKNEYRWQTYTPYVQGFAKKKLEDLAEMYSQRGINCCVYNCPEILTNSSSIFQGVEVSLYPLMQALVKEQGTQATKDFIASLLAKLHPGTSLDDIMKTTDEYLTDPTITSVSNLETWPENNNLAQMECMLSTSQKLRDLHIDGNDLITLPLSEVVFKGCGKAMLATALNPETTTVWLNHDLIARYF